MSKRKSRKNRARLESRAGLASADQPVAAAVAEADASVSEGIDLQLFGDELNAAVIADDSDRLQQLSSTPLERFRPADRAKAQHWLLYARVRVLYPAGTQSIYQLDESARRELEAALRVLITSVPEAYRFPEFDLYLVALGDNLAKSAECFQLLIPACQKNPSEFRLKKLAYRACVLLDPSDFGNPAPEEDHKAILATLPDIPATLAEVYAKVERDPSAPQELQLLSKVLRLDAALRYAEPGSRAPLIREIMTLPTPTLADLPNALLTETPWGEAKHQFTPLAWAFWLELEHADAQTYGTVLAQYPKQFGCEPVEGLRCIVESVVAEPQDRDRLLVQGIQLFMQFAAGFPDWFGDVVTVATSDGPVQLLVAGGAPGLCVLRVPEMLLKVIERLPEGYGRAPELYTLCRVLIAKLGASALADDGAGESDTDLPGIEWLCTQSPDFELAAAYVMQRPGGQAKHLLNAVIRCAEQGLVPTEHGFPVETEGQLSVPEAKELQTLLRRIQLLRPKMTDAKLANLWREAATNVFEKLKYVEELRPESAALARIFAEDLAAENQYFNLGYFEHILGEPGPALRYYLLEIDRLGEKASGTIGNLKLLGSQIKTKAQMEDCLAVLDGALQLEPIEPAADALKQLRTSVQASLQKLVVAEEKQAQFERTAVARWPELSGPARKLLTVLTTINSFSSMEELGTYANMDVAWVKRHYQTLVKTGMILDTGGKYTINPHIAPLVARESQHAVVGRIVRTQGTSAVKQVFNSQREFGIYQILCQLCPNHLVFPNCGLQSIMSFDKMKELVDSDTFGYYLRASVDLVVVSSTTYLPLLAIEVDSVYHDTERQLRRDEQKDQLFQVAGIPFLRLRPVGSPSEATIRAQVAEHLDELIRVMRPDLPGFEQARVLLEDLSARTGGFD